jgi:hypothetical protein
MYSIHVRRPEVKVERKSRKILKANRPLSSSIFIYSSTQQHSRNVETQASDDFRVYGRADIAIMASQTNPRAAESGCCK